MKVLFLIFAILISNVSYGAFQKSKDLPSGVTANYWKIIKFGYDNETQILDLHIKLYKDNTAGLAPLKQYQLSVPVSRAALLASGNMIAFAHQKILDYANSDIPNVDGNGTHKGFPDLIDATIVP